MTLFIESDTRKVKKTKLRLVNIGRVSLSRFKFKTLQPDREQRLS